MRLFRWCLVFLVLIPLVAQISSAIRTRRENNKRVAFGTSVCNQRIRRFFLRLPIRDAARVYTELTGNIALCQFQVELSCFQVVAEGLYSERI